MAISEEITVPSEAQDLMDLVVHLLAKGEPECLTDVEMDAYFSGIYPSLDRLRYLVRKRL